MSHAASSNGTWRARRTHRTPRGRWVCGRERDGHARAHWSFCQAEDGIRDYKETGVQTCALPISAVTPRIQERRCRANARLPGRGSLLYPALPVNLDELLCARPPSKSQPHRPVLTLHAQLDVKDRKSVV